MSDFSMMIATNNCNMLCKNTNFLNWETFVWNNKLTKVKFKYCAATYKKIVTNFPKKF